MCYPPLTPAPSPGMLGKIAWLTLILAGLIQGAKTQFAHKIPLLFFVVFYCSSLKPQLSPYFFLRLLDIPLPLFCLDHHNGKLQRAY